MSVVARLPACLPLPLSSLGLLPASLFSIADRVPPGRQDKGRRKQASAANSPTPYQVPVVVPASICYPTCVEDWRREQGTSYDNDEYLLAGMSIPEKLRIQSGNLAAAFVKGQFYEPSLFAPHPGLALSPSPLSAPSAFSVPPALPLSLQSLAGLWGVWALAS